MKNKELTNEDRTKCSVYTRVVGYLSPTEQWNNGKKEEFKDRVTYDKALSIANN